MSKDNQIKIKVNNGQELIAEAKKYKNSGGEWKLREKYMEHLGWHDSRKEQLSWGIIISNGERTVDICSVGGGSLTTSGIMDKAKGRTREQLHQLFPEAANALCAGSGPDHDRFGGRPHLSGLDFGTFKEMEGVDGKKYNLHRYLEAESAQHLTQIVHQWVQENKTAIQQSPNSDFREWVEIVDGQDGKDGYMYLYIGKKKKNNVGREIKIGIKKDKYFEKIEGIEGNRKAGGDDFYNAGEELEVMWDLMLITIGFAGWPLKFKERKNNNQPVSSTIKEKLLRNLDKICLDPIGYLANAELVKNSDIENDFYTNTPKWTEFSEKLYKIEIEGKEIDLRKVKWEDTRAVKNALISEIKQNPQDWKIENSNIYRYKGDGISNTIPDTFKVLRHKSGRRHWNVGIIYGTGNLEKGKQDW
jgi:hypothetical protein